MITNESIKGYLDRMYGNELYKELVKEDQEKIIFVAHELLKDNFKEDDITDRAVALQVLYMLEGEEEEYAKLKRQGVKSYSVKGVSVTFEGTEIAPAVIQLLEPVPKAKVGRLI
ncbi:hypothetical protein GCM10011409_19040 [Lentibacillus populi]|uniref:Uncharacterized protein n=1 Tax=Lentibacillus populi TaxID=1827502 RepID=A0A9W5X5C8_9BACI|nr:hypothetical protein [Lentibacillus populi]GGB41701.1 hypothetical protein GCM10011409_19040 [Lentibacillus populi]